MKAISLGFACNNACVFCAQGELRATASARTDLDGIVEGDDVSIQGGEPTLADDLVDLIASLDRRGARRIVLQTNGRRLAYRSYTRALREASSRVSLDVSLHGSTEAMHDFHTRVDGSFKQTAQGIRNARSESIDVAITTVVTRSNFRHAIEIARLAHALGARAIRFAIAERFGSAARAADRVIPARELAASHVDAAEREAMRFGLTIGGEAFAGIGAVEDVAIETRADRRALPMLGRPVPAKAEARGSPKRTGRDLEAILPALFRDEAE